ncbi:MAG: type II toxin-antitoxin system RelE/ParE family toxin [Gallionellaceae bacterium]|jgi:mRNA interferase RelE/StbE|nr:type II toxin-antitoxin system RelE/ParE family toxin [Gallionellaceae bacterium]
MMGIAALNPSYACYRIGDYRLVCEIKDRELIVWIIRVGHRREVYK